jgi:hypothetical protein
VQHDLPQTVQDVLDDRAAQEADHRIFHFRQEMREVDLVGVLLGLTL